MSHPAAIPAHLQQNPAEVPAEIALATRALVVAQQALALSIERRDGMEADHRKHLANVMARRAALVTRQPLAVRTAAGDLLVSLQNETPKPRHIDPAVPTNARYRCWEESEG